MKTGFFIIGTVAVLLIGYFVFFSKKVDPAPAPATKHEKPPRLAISKNPPAFNEAFANMLSSYYNVKNDLINWDSTKAGAEAKTLSQLASGLPINTLQADSNIVITAKNFAGVVSADSKHLSDAKTILEKRRDFSTITDNLYSLINTVRYDKEVIYYDMCPMAFNESEQAYWLSRDSAISNPYFGNKHPKYHGAMVTCGNVEQEIDYASAKK